MLGRTCGMSELLLVASVSTRARNKTTRCPRLRSLCCSSLKRRAAGLQRLDGHVLALNGAIADIEAVLHQVPVNGMHECVGLKLCCADAVTQAHRAQHP